MDPNLPAPGHGAPANAALDDARYRELANAVLADVEAAADRWLQDDVVDIDTHRTGGLLELTMPGGGKIVLNLQPPLHEIWLAARTGGRHFRYDGSTWRDTRDGTAFHDVLSTELTVQAGRPLRIDPAGN